MGCGGSKSDTSGDGAGIGDKPTYDNNDIRGRSNSNMHRKLLKVILLGDSGVGKSSIMNTYVHEKFTGDYKATIGADFLTKHLVVGDQTITMQIWDTAGQERFRTITSSFYRGAHGIIVVYDISDQATFNNVKLWMQEIQRYASAGVCKMLVGNKVDLADKRVVEYNTAKEYADGLSIPFSETSSKTGQEVDKVFEKLSLEILRQQVGGWGGTSSTNVIRQDHRMPATPPRKRC